MFYRYQAFPVGKIRGVACYDLKPAGRFSEDAFVTSLVIAPRVTLSNRARSAAETCEGKALSMSPNITPPRRDPKRLTMGLLLLPVNSKPLGSQMGRRRVTRLEPGAPVRTQATGVGGWVGYNHRRKQYNHPRCTLPFPEVV